MVVATIRLTHEQLMVWRERGPHAVRAWLDGLSDADSQERERCARICAEMAESDECASGHFDGITLQEVAYRIRGGL